MIKREMDVESNERRVGACVDRRPIVMRNYILLTFAVMAALGPAEALASKTKFYNFAELAIDSDITIIASMLRTEGNEIQLTVREYVVGSGPEKLKASFKIPFRRRSPGDIEGPRVVFLQQDEDGLRLFSSDLQAIWPQTVPEGREYPFADFGRGVDSLAGLCRQVRGFAHGESPAEVTSGLLAMLRSSDLFVRLTALQTCDHLRGLDPPKYGYAARLGSAFALEMVAHSDWRIRSASQRLMLSAPPSAALHSLLRAMSAPEVVRGSHDAAFVQFRSVTQEGRWDEQFQRLKRNPDRELRAEAVEGMSGWLDENFSRLFAEDYEMIVRALSSENIAMRTAGRIWLRAATGSDFGFDESGTLYQRTAALARVQEWWEKTRN